jgi:hypothetical protein
MGYASYTEDINDRRAEALAQQWFQIMQPASRVLFQPSPPAPRVKAKPLLPSPRIILRVVPKAALPVSAPTVAPAMLAADRSRQARDIHVLCLAELRPKAQPEYHARP